jgi:outer membrane receptor for ferrienterochelin and colicin
MPNIPALTLKLNLGYKPDERTHLGLQVMAQGPQYARGDENNQDINGQIPGFATVKLNANHELSKDTEIIGSVNNLFNTSYANFGVLATNNISGIQNEQFRSVGAPRSLYAGLRMKF